MGIKIHYTGKDHVLFLNATSATATPQQQLNPDPCSRNPRQNPAQGKLGSLSSAHPG